MGWRTEEAGVERVFWHPRSTNVEMEGERQGEPCLWDALVSNERKLQTQPPFKISDISSVGGRTVISHLPNISRERFRARRVCFGAHRCRSPCMNRGARRLCHVRLKLQTYPYLRPIEIEPTGFACQGQAIISISQNLVKAEEGLCVSPLRSNFRTVPTQFEPILYSSFSGRIHFVFQYKSLCIVYIYIYIQKHDKELCPFYVQLKCMDH